MWPKSMHHTTLTKYNIPIIQRYVIFKQFYCTSFVIRFIVVSMRCPCNLSKGRFQQSRIESSMRHIRFRYQWIHIWIQRYIIILLPSYGILLLSCWISWDEQAEYLLTSINLSMLYTLIFPWLLTNKFCCSLYLGMILQYAFELNAKEILAVRADYILVDGWTQSEG